MTKITKHLSAFVLILFCHSTHGQISEKSFIVNETNAKITPDGILNEPVWTTADQADEFWQYFPLDTVQQVGS